MTEYRTEAAVVADLARESADPPEQVEGLPGIYLSRLADGSTQVVDLTKRLPYPQRKSGTAATGSVAAFVAYWHKHSTGGESEIWARASHNDFTAVFNPHLAGSLGATGAGGWGDHRATLELNTSDAWDRWVRLNAATMTQEQFAEHIEERLADISSPPAADMLELAQSFQATRSGEFEQGQRLQSGQTTLVYKETIAAKAGQRGQLDIPDTFALTLRVYDDGKPVRVQARLRYRIREQRLTLSYHLIDHKAIREAAFSEVAEEIGNACGSEVWEGTPA